MTTKLTKLIQNYNGGNEALNEIFKHALFVERKCLVAEKALELACECVDKDYSDLPVQAPDYWIDEAVKILNQEEQNEN